jgi:hypothetical protein
VVTALVDRTAVRAELANGIGHYTVALAEEVTDLRARPLCEAWGHMPVIPV